MYPYEGDYDGCCIVSISVAVQFKSDLSRLHTVRRKEFNVCIIES